MEAAAGDALPATTDTDTARGPRSWKKESSNYYDCSNYYDR